MGVNNQYQFSRVQVLKIVIFFVKYEKNECEKNKQKQNKFLKNE